MDGIDASSGIDNVRSIYERAVTAVGLHLTEVLICNDAYILLLIISSLLKI